MGVDSADWGKAGPGGTQSGGIAFGQSATILTGGSSAVLAAVTVPGTANLQVWGSVDKTTFYRLQFVILSPPPPSGAVALVGGSPNSLILIPCAGMVAIQFQNVGIVNSILYTAVAVSADPFLPLIGQANQANAVPVTLANGGNTVWIADSGGGSISAETWNSIGRLTASTWPAAVDLQGFSAPAAATAASVVIAAQAGHRLITADGSWSYGAGTGIAAGDLRNVDLLDGATAIWVGRLGIQAAVGYSKDLPVPKGLFSTTGNSMTANFNAAGPANSFQACGLAVKIS